MNSKGVTSVYQGLVVVFCILFCIMSSYADEHCPQPVGKLVSIQGEAQIQHAGAANWKAISLDAALCPGDVFRTSANSRAAIVLTNESILRIDQKSTITFPNAPEDKYSVLELLRGVLHIFSHRPRSLKIVTPYVNGVVEGTEFLVSADQEKSIITVFEGVVVAVNQQGELRLSSNQSVIAQQGAAPTYLTVVRPRDAVAWTLYYPAILELPDPASQLNAADIMVRVGQFLAVGRVEEAGQLLDKAIKDDPQNGEAYALSSIIATVQNNKEKALQLASEAIDRNPQSAAAGLALSYARQSQFDLPGALEALQQAAQANPENGLIQARLAEILLSVGEIDQSLAAAKQAVSLNPNIGLTQAVLGFVHLSRVEIDEAFTAFTESIILDPALPLARLGLGLAKIRKGMVEEGRADIEIAAALDPGNAVIRSYLGKAYFEEKRDRLSQRQYDIAKELDPADPTPWLYDAFRKQSINRPVEALHDIQKSIELNDNRAVYRSRLFLDDDLASRSAGLGRIFTDLGFEQLAQVEGWKSLQADPSNYSAHRFLSDTFGSQPRHEVAKVSELLVSQLLQPLNITAVQPQLAESNLQILEGAGPSISSFNEFNPLFLRDRLSLQASGVVGSDEILGDEIVVSGVKGKISYSLGQFHYETDGIRQNSDQDLDIYSGFFQAMLTPSTSILAEIRYREKDFGDIAHIFFPEDSSDTVRQDQENKSARFGIRHDLSPNSTLLGTVLVSSDEEAGTTGNDPDDGFFIDRDFTSDVDSQMAEFQHIFRKEKLKVQSGFGYLNADDTFTNLISSLNFFSKSDSDIEHINLYSYAQIDLPYDIIATLGLSGDILDSSDEDYDELNPKVGVTWKPRDDTLVRAAAFKSFARRIISAQTIEPVLIAGFNQYFDDFAESTIWTYGIGIDHTFCSNLFGGAKYFHRDLDVPYLTLNDMGMLILDEDDWQEDIGSAYLYWAPLNWLSLGLEYYFERFSRDELEGFENILELTTHRITPKIQYFHPSGVTTSIQTSFIDQEGDFVRNTFEVENDSDQFFVIDLLLSYRLPDRYGIIRLEVKNLLDESFRYLDTDPANPRFLSEQQIIGSFTIAF